MSETPTPPVVALNPTDRNISTAHGLWKGHVTLPCSFVTLGAVAILTGFLLVLHWQFDQQTQMRERLQRQTEIIHSLLLEKGVEIPPIDPGSPDPGRHPTRK